MSADQLKAALLDRIEDLAPYLYPMGRREGRHWDTGDETGVPGKSFRICLNGANAGMHGDFAGGDRHRSSPLDLWMTARQVDFLTACREARAWLGIPPETRQRGAAPRTVPRKVPSPLEPIPPLTQEIMDLIREGMRFASAATMPNSVASRREPASVQTK